MSGILARVTAYRGFLVAEVLVDASVPDGCHLSTDNPGVIGQVIMDTGKNLGVSREAVELIESVRVGDYSMGDVDWFESVCGDTFSWVGGTRALIKASLADGARTLRVRSYVEIPNDVSAEAIDAIDSGVADAEWDDED